MVEKKKYVPQKGDVVWVNLDPAAGHEQKGRRPALVISAIKYNAASGMCLVCPITSVVKTYPFIIELEEKQKTKGAILCDQIKSIDWRARKVTYVEKINKKILENILERISLLI